MSIEPEFEIKYLDSGTGTIETLKSKDMQEQIDKIKRVLEYVLKQMQVLGDYEISEFTASASIEAGAWILKANGAVSITWNKAG